MTTLTNDKSNTVAVEEVKSFIQRCMEAVGTSSKHAVALADNLTAADHRGHFSHGFNRLEMYVNDIQNGITVSGDLEPSILKQTVATAHVDGNNLLGPVVGNFCMELAIQKAKDAGVGWVAAKGSNHYGIAGWYAMLASEQGLMGLSFCNTSPLVVPTRARTPTLGTNPISLAAPGRDGDSFVLDMATSAVALGKIEIANVKGAPIPDGWGTDEKGQVCNDPKSVINGGGLLPLGGAEISSGYKGYGLGMLTEIFCGILSGSMWGPNIRQWKTTDTIANLGQCFIAVDPEAFGSGFSDRMQDFMDTCRALEPAEGETEVLVPGDPERQHIAKCDAQGGIEYHPNLIQIMNKLASRLSVAELKTLA